MVEMPHNQHLLDRFMTATDKLKNIFGQADRADIDSPVVHRHDDFEEASAEDLSHFEVEADSEGHHYGTRKPDSA
jgi:hypothetical protein